MTDKNVQLKNTSGDALFPKTKGAVVFNNSNQNLGSVEAGAQVNVIETVKVNGTALAVSNKAVDITIPASSEYTIAKKSTAESGYSASYYLTKDGTKVGEYINIPKDMVVESGEVKTVTTADTPVTGYKVGDKYIDLVIANKSNSHLYILVSDLVDVYTAGNGITISGNAVSVDTSVVATQSDISTINTALSGKQATLSSTNKLDPAYIATNANNRFVTDTEKSGWSGKQAAITSSNKLSSDLVDDTNKTHLFVSATEKSTWNGKANAATTLAGYGITDGVTYEELA